MKPKSEWYKEWFDEVYLEVYHYRDLEEAREAVSFAVDSLKIELTDAILDLGCGAGRHSIALAEKGFLKIYGIDLSQTLIKRARKESGKKGLSIRFEMGDMRNLPYKNQFNAILSFFTSFGYFDDEEENFKVVENMAKVLLPRGKLFFDHINAAYQMNHLIPYSERELYDKKIIERRFLSDEKTRIKKDISVLMSDGSIKHYSESVRIYSPEELIDTFSQVGIEIFKTAGDYTGEPLTTDSPRMILLGRKK